MIALVGDTEIAFDDIGTGLPLVFLHGFPLNRTMWDPQVSALVGECRCIAIDLRGFGESAAAEPYSMDRYADDVVGVLDTLSIERAVIVGHSMGGYIAFALMRRHRARVRALVLANTRATSDTVETIERRREMIDIAEAQGSSAVANMQIAGLMGKTSRERRPDSYDAIHRMMAQAPVAGIVGALEAMIARPDSTAMLGAINVPTLVIGGDEDVIVRPRDVRAMQEAIPSSRIEIFNQAGHLSSVERPAAFNTVLSEFVSSLLYN